MFPCVFQCFYSLCSPGSRSGFWSSSWSWSLLSWRRNMQRPCCFPTTMADSDEAISGFVTEVCFVLGWISPPSKRRPHWLASKRQWSWRRKRTNALRADAPTVPVLLHHILLEAEGRGFSWRRGLQHRSTEDDLRDFKYNPLYIDRCLKHPYGFCLYQHIVQTHTHTHTHTLR